MAGNKIGQPEKSAKATFAPDSKPAEPSTEAWPPEGAEPKGRPTSDRLERETAGERSKPD